MGKASLSTTTRVSDIPSGCVMSSRCSSTMYRKCSHLARYCDGFFASHMKRRYHEQNAHEDLSRQHVDCPPDRFIQSAPAQTWSRQPKLEAGHRIARMIDSISWAETAQSLLRVRHEFPPVDGRELLTAPTVNHQSLLREVSRNRFRGKSTGSHQVTHALSSQGTSQDLQSKAKTRQNYELVRIRMTGRTINPGLVHRFSVLVHLLPG